MASDNGNISFEFFTKTSFSICQFAAVWCARAAVPKGTRYFYSVRHNFGTEMANEGMPLPALANLMGHSDVKMTMRYYNMNKKTIDKARDILNRRAVVNT
jgi:integrase